MRKRVLALVAALLTCLCPLAMGEDDSQAGVDQYVEDEVRIAAEVQISVDDFAETENLPDEWWNVLLLGTDNRYDLKGRTDSMIILSVNLAEQEAKLTSLMRDTWIPTLYGRNSGAKLNAANVYGGPELAMRTVNEYFGMNVSRYVLVNITGMADIIDTLGGLELDVTEAERKALNRGLFDLSSQSGMEELEYSGTGVHLNGNQAVAFSRIRNIDSDYRRTERQRVVLTAIAEKLRQNDSVSIVGVIGELLPFVQTNLDFVELMSLSYVGLRLDLDAIEQLRLPADGSYESGNRNGTWSIRPDFQRNRDILYDFIYGE